MGQGQSVVMSPAPTLERAREVLRRTFGHEEFKGFQAPVIQTLLDGKSALAVLPTGGGKSLCYRSPACSGTAWGSSSRR